MKRSRLKRRTPLRRRTRINPRNAARAAARRERDFGDLAEYVRGLGCLVCRARPADPAHVRSRGAGGHAWIDDPFATVPLLPGQTQGTNLVLPRRVGNLIPLCRTHHREQHDRGIVTFAETHGLDLAAEARRIGEAFGAGDA